MTEDTSPPADEAAEPDSQANESPEAAPDQAAKKPAKKPPEPMTPERLKKENGRNDLFIAIGVLLVAFLLASFKIVNPYLWVHLKSGWHTETIGVPTEDPFSFASKGRKWVDQNWLFGLGLYQFEKFETARNAKALQNRYTSDLGLRLFQAADTDESGGLSDLEFTSATTKGAFSDWDSDGELLFDEIPPEGMNLFMRSFKAADLPEGGVAGNISPAMTQPQLSELRTLLERLDEVEGTRDTRMLAGRLVDLGKAVGLEAAQTDPTQATLINLTIPTVVKAMIIALAAFVLLLIRREGPTKWWAALAVLIAMLGAHERFGFGPECFSLLFFAFTLYALHLASNGARWALFVLPVMFLAWSNLDSMFPLGLVAILLYIVGEAIGSGNSKDSKGETSKGLAVVGAVFIISIVATCLTPYGPGVWSVPIKWWELYSGSESPFVRQLLPELLSPVSAGFWTVNGEMPSLARILQTELALLVAGLGVLLALVTFILNLKNFSWTRLLTLVAFSGIALLAQRFAAYAAFVAAVTLSLNGQEWFLGKFGTETRVTKGWLFWSQSGRAVTVLAIGALAVCSTFGWLWPQRLKQFGYGIQWANQQTDTSWTRFISSSPMKGKTMNMAFFQGNLGIWANYPERQVYIDQRFDVHLEDLKEYRDLLLAFRDGEKSQWGEICDKYGVSHVVLDFRSWGRYPFPGMVFRTSTDWELVHVDAANTVFGLTSVAENDPRASDARWIKSNVFDPRAVALAEIKSPLPDPPAPITPPGWMDRLTGIRQLGNYDSKRAENLLNPIVTNIEQQNGLAVAPLESCLLAIRSARRGLSGDQIPLDSYALLADAYLYLRNREQIALIEGYGEEAPAVAVVNELRQIQLLTALNQVVTANPRHPAHFELFRRYMERGYEDLAARHLRKYLDLFPARPISDESEDPQEQLILQLEALEAHVAEVRDELDALIDQMPSPLQQKDYLLRVRCPGLAIEQIQAYVEQYPESEAVLLPELSSLFMSTGQLGDENSGAFDAIRRIPEQTELEAGVKEEISSMMQLMAGDYDQARQLLEASIAQTRFTMLRESLDSFRTDLLSPSTGIMQGNVPTIAKEWTEMPFDVNRWARLEFYLGLIQLEAGEPGEAERHLRQSIKIQPETPYYPIAAMYLEELTGKPWPRKRESTTTDASKASESQEGAATDPKSPAPLPEGTKGDPQPSDPKSTSETKKESEVEKSASEEKKQNE